MEVEREKSLKFKFKDVGPFRVCLESVKFPEKHQKNKVKPTHQHNNPT